MDLELIQISSNRRIVLHHITDVIISYPHVEVRMSNQPPGRTYRVNPEFVMPFLERMRQCGLVGDDVAKLVSEGSSLQGS